MSTLYKRKGTPYYWWSSFYKGKRVAQSTKMSNKKLARKIRELWDYNLIVGDLEFLGLSNIPTKFLTEYISEYLKFIESRKTNGSVEIATGVLNKFKEYMTNRKILRLDDLTVKVLNEYIDNLTKMVKDGKDGFKEVSVAPKTKRNHLQEISLMLDQAVIEEIIQSNPSKKVTLPIMKKTKENRVLTLIDLKTIFSKSGSWTLYYAFLYHTGLRAGDVAVLKHGNIDFKKKAIVSFIKKSRRIHEFPLPTVLLELIPKGKNSSEPLFPELYNERRKKVKDNLAKPRKYMQALLTANGLEWATLHSFRHTFNTSLRDLGLSIEDRQILLAHASSEVNKIYTHPNFDLASQYVNRIPSFQYNQMKRN